MNFHVVIQKTLPLKLAKPESDGYRVGGEPTLDLNPGCGLSRYMNLGK